MCGAHSVTLSIPMASGSDRKRVVEAYLDDAAADLELVGAAIQLGNRHAAYHLQQAAEKLVKAVRLDRDLEPTKEHRIEILIDGDYEGKPPHLTEDDPWRDRLLALDPLSRFATAYRYPTTSGKLKDPPPAEELSSWLEQLHTMLAELRAELLGP